LKPQYKLIALDMDGTVLNERQEISEANKTWIRKATEAGIIVSFATGRGSISIQPYIDELKLESPVVSVNGSEVYKRPWELLSRHTLDPQDVLRMHELAVKYDSWFWAYAVDGLYNKDKWDDDVEAHQWLKFGYYNENNRHLGEILDALTTWGGMEITNSHPNNLELNPKGVSKASGLRELCGILGIEMSQVVAMGDSLNDIAMICEAGLGVAMGNAQQEVKDAADIVTLTNEEDGVARVIRDIVLGK
jgi:HAD superfamily hydrolase (TIGR01484 family)